ncbi:MAG: hypothetical protein QM831_32475 [Kofleriaceae bacterium]
MKTIELTNLAAVTGGATGDFPGFTNCGPNYFSKGCIDGGMNLEEQLAISQGAKMVTGQKATFKNWANWMRSHNYPSAALDKIGWPKK